MNKKKLLAQINNKVQEVKDLVAQDKITEAKAAKEELKKLQDKYDLIKDMEDDEKDDIKNGKKPTKPVGNDAVKDFADAARKGFPKNSMSEGSNEDGGYAVPEDIETKINTYRESKASLIDEVDVKPVKHLKGAQTYKKRSQQTGFVKVSENGKISKKDTPKFERLTYEIAKYAGYFPVTNELLDDSDENIAQILIEWIGDESRVTRNKIILEKVGTKDKTVFKTADDVKKAKNVTLGAAFKNTSKIYTNDDGFNWLDTLKDGNGNYLLQPIATDDTKYKIFGLEVKVYPNADMPSDVSVSGKRTIPMVIGDLKEGIRFFDRKKLTITASDIAQIGDLNAFEQDLTLWRAIEREDCKVKDSEAFVNGVITIDDPTVVVSQETQDASESNN